MSYVDTAADSDGEDRRGARRCSSTSVIGIIAVALMSLVVFLVGRQRSHHPTPVVLPEGVRLGKHDKLRRHGADYAHRAHGAGVLRRQVGQQKQRRQRNGEVYSQEVSRTVREAQTDPNSMFDMSTP